MNHATTQGALTDRPGVFFRLFAHPGGRPIMTGVVSGHPDMAHCPESVEVL